MKRLISDIKNRCFKNHKASYSEHGDLKVLTWKEEGTIAYYVRYVFDGYKMYISGDMGEAVFCFTERVDVHTFDDYHIQYFYSKLRAYDGDKWSFNKDKAVKGLREWLRDLKECDIAYDHDYMRELFKDTRDCSNYDDWKYVFQKHYDFISDIDNDWWEWIPSIGNEIPSRIQAYLIGLKMASEQLKKVCALCSTPFVIDVRTDVKYCPKCRKGGPQEFYKQKIDNNPFLKLIEREYQRRYSKIRDLEGEQRTIGRKEIGEWKKKAKQKMNEPCMTIDEFNKWIKDNKGSW